MLPVRFIKRLPLACLLGLSVIFQIHNVYADSEKEKPSRAELEKRIRKLELKAKIGKHIDFVSRGQLTIFGIDLPTVPPTPEEIEQEEAQPKGN